MPHGEIGAERLLANIALFKALDAATRSGIAAQTSKRRLRRGEFVFHRGETPEGFFFVVFGEIALLGPSNRLTGLVGAGRSFGEPMMFLRKPYIVDARAQTDSLLLAVPQQAVFAEIERNPAFAQRMIAGLAARIESLVGELDSRTRGSAKQRLIAYLLRGRAANGEAIFTLPVTKAALARQLNMTAEHFSRILRELAQRGLVRVERRRIEIPDVRALAAHGRGARPET